jgi:hypothetical protein
VKVTEAREPEAGRGSGWRARRGRAARRVAWAAGVVALVAVLFCGAAGTALLAEDSGPVSARAHTMGDDALWLGHAWVDGRHGPADLNALVARLKTTGIRDLFVHSGPLSDDGSLDPALRPRARWLTSALHRALPQVRVQAWLGALVGGGHLDLADPATRARIVASARAVVADGFDGVHLDLEPLADGDAGCLTLLTQVRAVTPFLSVAAPQVRPLGWLSWPALHPHWWSAGYLHEVATRVDQVAVMTYDTGMPAGALYAGYLHRETELALRAVPPDVSLLIGLPAYRSTALGHFSSAETVSAAIRGVRLAISPVPPDRPLGVALYVDFTATARDWAQYQAGWNKPSVR